MKPATAPVRLSAVLLLALVLLPAAALAQNPYDFAIGAGGTLVNDTGTAANVKSFGTGGGYLFFDVKIDRWVVLQLRANRFTLPGTAPNSPNLRADAGTISIGYFFREEWWQAGMYVGGGVYDLRPNDPEPGQVAADGKETVLGWTGALVSVFDVSPRWDVRLEAGGHLIRTVNEHKPLFLAASVAYHF